MVRFQSREHPGTRESSFEDCLGFNPLDEDPSVREREGHPITRPNPEAIPHLLRYDDLPLGSHP